MKSFSHLDGAINLDWLDFNTLEHLSGALCDRVIADLGDAVDQRGAATLVLSGGKTPLSYLPVLFAAPVAWEKVHITLSDERWVPPGHPDSNEGMVRRLMAGTPAAAASVTSLWFDTATPLKAEGHITERLSSMPRPFDVAILGMGEDGHIASLFPGTGAALSDAALCLAVSDAPLHPRMSLSPGALTSTRNPYLCATGAAKQRVLKQAMGGCDVNDLPVGLLTQLPARDRLRVYAIP